MTPLVGTSLKNGKYLLKKEIGRGIAGISYKATNKVLNEQVVIKTLNLALAHKSYLAELRKKFLNEARRLVRCSHPNIITFSRILRRRWTTLPSNGLYSRAKSGEDSPA